MEVFFTKKTKSGVILFLLDSFGVGLVVNEWV